MAVTAYSPAFTCQRLGLPVSLACDSKLFYRYNCSGMDVISRQFPSTFSKTRDSGAFCLSKASTKHNNYHIFGKYSHSPTEAFVRP